jgi:hypothetical protein
MRGMRESPGENSAQLRLLSAIVFSWPTAAREFYCSAMNTT